MKKILLCLSLCAALFLVGCNNNEKTNNENNPNNNNNNNNIVVSGEETPEEDESPIVQYDSPDFTEKAGFKVNLGTSLEGVTYDSIFLMNNSTAQLDLIFPDKTIGTLLIDSMGSTHLYDKDETVFVEDTEVSIKVGADGISVYEWVKDDYTYVYSTTLNLKGSETLNSLVNEVSVEVKDELEFRDDLTL